jgi:flavodoxin I
MNATIVVYGSSTGTCEAIAEKIAQKLGCEAINVQDLTADVVNANQNLILGTSTWGAGELQDDWYDGLKVLQGADLSGKTIALFGCGDCESYSDTFVGGIGELYNGIKAAIERGQSQACLDSAEREQARTEFKASGARFVGAVDTDGYTFDDSEAVIDGKFIGLPLDDVNEDDKTDTRIDAWIAEISPNL